MFQILVVDDDKNTRTLMKLVLEADNYSVLTAGNGEEALAVMDSSHVDLVVLDVMMPGTDGFETMAAIRAKSSVPILMLTAKTDHLSKVRGLRAGADDYMTKPFDLEELLARIHSLIRRYTRLNPGREQGALLHYRGLVIDPDTHTIITDRGTFDLPPKEFDLLFYCARHQGRILTKAQIYEAVWGEPYFYDDSNIMAVISRLRKKLEADPSHPRYLQTVKGLGYRFSKDV